MKKERKKKKSISIGRKEEKGEKEEREREKENSISRDRWKKFLGPDDSSPAYAEFWTVWPAVIEFL